MIKNITASALQTHSAACLTFRQYSSAKDRDRNKRSCTIAQTDGMLHVQYGMSSKLFSTPAMEAITKTISPESVNKCVSSYC